MDKSGLFQLGVVIYISTFTFVYFITLLVTKNGFHKRPSYICPPRAPAHYVRIRHAGTGHTRSRRVARIPSPGDRAAVLAHRARTLPRDARTPRARVARGATNPAYA